MNEKHQHTKESLFSLQLPQLGWKGYLLLGIGLTPYVVLQLVHENWIPFGSSEENNTLETILMVIVFLECLFVFPGCFFGFAYTAKDRGNRIVCLLIGSVFLVIACVGAAVGIGMIWNPR